MKYNHRNTIKTKSQKIILDTDMGNDIDDALALALIHALQSRSFCELLAVTLTKDHPQAAPFVQAVNTFYQRPNIPIGTSVNGPKTPPINNGNFINLITKTQNNQPLYPHHFAPDNKPIDAIRLLRKTLAQAEDHSIKIIQIGFFSNLSQLLDTQPDQFSPMTGIELVTKKVELLSAMAGAFIPIDNNDRFAEYNIIHDLPAAQNLIVKWPTPIVLSGFEVGNAITYPACSIQNDFNYTNNHIIKDAYNIYAPPPHCRPTWDLTSVLFAILPKHDYFSQSPLGKIVIENDGHTTFIKSKKSNHTYLKVDSQQISRAKEAFVQLVSQPPNVPLENISL